ncbi:ANL_HP_G0102440.mRNA.1.CDS.1 [Saccharomyces cerevisiae]|nr:ANL_HP_G0102440.mRNA.1.CDS.1 [Saccharomyces cerevisiae]CAI6971046.1 ANL_HP_G0102440.mRNA.1.CDS.1 [Saccharomyces cerevisiae]
MKVKDAGEESVVSVAVDSELVEDLYIDEQEEKALVKKKLDFRLLPMLAFMYFLSSLDRSNIGNASHLE